MDRIHDGDRRSDSGRQPDPPRQGSRDMFQTEVDYDPSRGDRVVRGRIVRGDGDQTGEQPSPLPQEKGNQAWEGQTGEPDSPPAGGGPGETKEPDEPKKAG